MSTILIVQSRMGSSRLPGKMMLDFCGKPLVERVLERVKASQLVDRFIVAAPVGVDNDSICKIALKYGYDCYRGDENDVLDRFYQALIKIDPDVQNSAGIVRVCADNPFVDAGEIDRLIEFFDKNHFDYAFNNVPAMGNNYPDGLGAEILHFALFKKMWHQVSLPLHREHVTKYIWDNVEQFTIGILSAPSNIAFPDIKLDVDTAEDYVFMKSLYQQMLDDYGDVLFSPLQIVNCYKKINHPNGKFSK